MDDRLIARLVAAGRVLFGIMCLAAPRQILRQDGRAASPAIVWWIRAFGVRDAVLGAGALVSLSDEGSTDTSWVKMGALADTGDVAITLVMREELGPKLAVPTLAIAAPAAILGWKSALGLGKR